MVFHTPLLILMTDLTATVMAGKERKNIIYFISPRFKHNLRMVKFKFSKPVLCVQHALFKLNQKA